MAHYYFECDFCNKKIPFGAAYVCIQKSIEQYDMDATTDDLSVDVIHAEALVTMCGPCGNKFNDELLTKLIMMTPNIRNSKMN